MMGPYELMIGRGAGGGDPLISIERRTICPQTAAHTSAGLLDKGPREIIGRPGRGRQTCDASSDQ